jgi:hypothetical protein
MLYENGVAVQVFSYFSSMHTYREATTLKTSFASRTLAFVHVGVVVSKSTGSTTFVEVHIKVAQLNNVKVDITCSTYRQEMRTD